MMSNLHYAKLHSIHIIPITDGTRVDRFNLLVPCSILHLQSIIYLYTMIQKKQILVLLTTIFFAVLCSCSKDDDCSIPSDTRNEESVGNIVTRMNASVVPFASSIGTRSTDSDQHQWNDADIIYLKFHTFDNKIVKGKAVYIEEDDLWKVSYDDFITKNETLKVEGTYIDKPVKTYGSSVVMDEQSCLYVDKEGTYVYPSKGIPIINLKLKPQSGRIRYIGTPHSKFYVDGLKYASTYLIETEAIDSTTKIFELATDDSGYTPYLYCTFENMNDPIMTVTNDNHSFTAQCNNTMLQKGKSGWMFVPAAEEHNGWREIQIPVESVVVNGYSRYWLIGTKDTLTYTVQPINATSTSIQFYASGIGGVRINDNIIECTDYGTVKIYALASNPTRSFYSYTIEIVDTDARDYVDLGLANGTLWATVNVGAESVEEIGERTPWLRGDYIKYPYLGYGTIISDKWLEERWKGDWRIPSKTDFDQMNSACNRKRETINGIDGYRYTSKKNGNSIFLPDPDAHSFDGRIGRYWTSTPYYPGSNWNEQEVWSFILDKGYCSPLQSSYWYQLPVRAIITDSRKSYNEFE